MKQTPLGVMAIGVVLGCTGTDSTEVLPAEQYNPPVSIGNGSLEPDNPNTATDPANDASTASSGGSSGEGSGKGSGEKHGGGGTAQAADSKPDAGQDNHTPDGGPLDGDPLHDDPVDDDPLDGDPLDAGTLDADTNPAPDATNEDTPSDAVCQANSWRCEGRLITRCLRDGSGHELLRDCFSEAACSEAAQACNDGNCADALGCGAADLVPAGAGVFSVSAGIAHTCAVLGGGALRCWGNNRRGQLGYGHKESIGNDEVPAAAGDVDLGMPVVQVVTGLSHTCALSSGGEVRCWGDSRWGKYGTGNLALLTEMADAAGRSVDVGDDEPAYHALPVALDGRAIQLSAGEDFTCALLDDGRVRCWGRNSTATRPNTGILGVPSHAGDIGDDEALSEPFIPAIDLGGPAAFIASGSRHTCAILRSGGVRCFGNGEWGKLGYGHSAGRNDAIGDDESPASAGDVHLEGRALWLSAGEQHTCAVLDRGLLRCWGEGVSGKLGYIETTHLGDDELPSARPAVNLEHDVKRVSAAADHTCALLSNDTVRCWGNNDYGQLGGPTSFRNAPLSIAADHVDLGNAVRELDGRGWHMCVVLSDQQLMCWGRNAGAAGILGYAVSQSGFNIGDDETPIQVGPVQISGAPPAPDPNPAPDSDPLPNPAPTDASPPSSPGDPTDAGN